MNPYAAFIAVCILVFAAVAVMAVWEVVAHWLVGYDAGAELATRPGEHWSDVNAVPEPTWATPFDERQRLRPVQPRRPRVPGQRVPGGES